jgi:WD40 repeat protein
MTGGQLDRRDRDDYTEPVLFPFGGIAVPHPLAVLLTVAALASTAQGAAPPKGGTTRLPYFPTTVGARWVCRTGEGERTSVVTAVEEKDGTKIVTVSILMEDGNLFPMRKVSVSDRGLFLVWLLDAECKPPVCLLRHPPVAGEKWENLSIVANFPYRELAEASGPEQIVTPAGTFQTFRVDSRTTAGFGGGWTPTTVWYAPGIGVIKQVSEERSSVLVSFTPGGAAPANEKLPPVLRSPRSTITLDSEADPVAYRPDGITLAVANRDGSISLRDVKSGKETAKLRGRGERVQGLAYSPAGKTLASAVGLWGAAQFGPVRGSVEVWDVPSGKIAATLGGHEGVVTVLAYSPDGRTLAAGSDSAIKMWDVQTGKERATWKGHAKRICSLAFTPDSKTLASSGYDREVRLWDVETGKGKAIFQGHSSVLSVAFSPDGRALASATEDAIIKLWDVETGKEQATLKGHTTPIWCVAYSRDGRTLASGSEYGAVKLWDVASGKELATLMGHENRVCSVAFSPDGKALLSASIDRTIKLWDVPAARTAGK